MFTPAVLAASLLILPMAGSDGPTPYTVDNSGITLPAGQTFHDNGHINVRTTANVTYNLHFEDRNWPKNHPKRAYIGESFIPWSAFGIPEGQVCIQWVQLSDYNEHFGEGGQTVVGPDCAAPSDPNDPKTTPTPTPEPTEEPSEEPTPEPTEEPTPDPTDDPTEEPTPEPSETPTTPPGPVEPAGTDMQPYLLTGGGILLATGGALFLASALRRKESR